MPGEAIDLSAQLGVEHSTHRVGHVFVGSDDRQQVGEARRRLADFRSFGFDLWQRVHETQLVVCLVIG